MTADQACAVVAKHIDAWPAEADQTRMEQAAIVLAAEVLRLREQVAHLERLALRSRSAGAGR